jgi:hypothetical protein
MKVKVTTTGFDISFPKIYTKLARHIQVDIVNTVASDKVRAIFC